MRGEEPREGQIVAFMSSGRLSLTGLPVTEPEIPHLHCCVHVWYDHAHPQVFSFHRILLNLAKTVGSA